MCSRRVETVSNGPTAATTAVLWSDNGKADAAIQFSLLGHWPPSHASHLRVHCFSSPGPLTPHRALGPVSRSETWAVNRLPGGEGGARTQKPRQLQQGWGAGLISQWDDWLGRTLANERPSVRDTGQLRPVRGTAVSDVVSCCGLLWSSSVCPTTALRWPHHCITTLLTTTKAHFSCWYSLMDCKSSYTCTYISLSSSSYSKGYCSFMSVCVYFGPIGFWRNILCFLWR